MTIDAPAVGAPIGAWYDEITAAVNGLAFEPQYASDVTSGSTTSTSYTSTLTGATALSITFTATRTWHMVEVRGLIIQAVSGPWSQYINFQVVGTGYSYGPVDGDAIYTQWTNNSVSAMTSARSKITGLTVGNSYTVTMQYKSSGVQINISRRGITVE